VTEIQRISAMPPAGTMSDRLLAEQAFSRAAGGPLLSDLEDIPQSVRTKLEFVWAEKIEDVLARALGEPPAQRAAA
jgi:hypothetical protein